ncbi:glycoside hydrolase family 15 protein [Kocuria sediminis]|uniref:Glycoside hydrolase family 15 protein n=1 Tax=Kocuria sediminis TaxID=1038857 RepID=A0A6N8GLK5_9MICC|nr:glycoside hydrolase family 15 protein [Kocuria sediminis]MUN63112.1 glycoside hydrolase family 15 protein [Kocuria sediminis]
MTGPGTAPAPSPPAPIGSHGLLADTRTAALVADDGTIDWCCLPAFDGTPVFGSLLGGACAGHFRMGPLQPGSPPSRRYREDTATLETTWVAGSARLTLTETMIAEVSGRLLPSTLLIRRLSAEGEPVAAVVDFDPRLGEHHRRPRIRRHPELICDFGRLALSLDCHPRLDVLPGRPATVTVAPGRPVTVVLAAAFGEPLVHVDPATAWDLADADEAFWRHWVAGIRPDLPHRPAVVRSLLTLRLLTHSPTGAPVAAPTTSLPEEPGGVRNWDYRYTWPRDASIGVATFLAVGKPVEAEQFLRWLLHAGRLDRPRLPALLTLTGCRVPEERTLTGWPGYAGSTPVRTGNGAAAQHQLDGYGWVLDAAWGYERSGRRLNSETWRTVRGLADTVARRWREPDAGIWEIRDDAAHHVHSKLMGWLALDRALRLGATHRLAERQRRCWERARAALADQIRTQGFAPVLGSYTRAYGSTDLDAALLVLPVLGFDPPGSPRTRGTVDAVRRELSAGGPLLYRYPPGRDGLPGGEGAFLPCSFWLVQALARTGRRFEALALFEDLLGRAGPLGLFGEEMDPVSGEHLGNFPQALTHAALVQAALSLRCTAPADRG